MSDSTEGYSTAELSFWIPLLIGLPISGSSARRLFTILALVPLRKMPDEPRLIHLGGHFFHEHCARLEVDHADRQGRLLIPW